MAKYLVSLDELDRVKRVHGLRSISDLSRQTGLSRPTWSKAVNTRRPTPDVLDALADLGARASRVLVVDDDCSVAKAV